MQKLIWILWPSFVVAGIAEALFFTLIDPQELYLFGEPVSFADRDVLHRLFCLLGVVRRLKYIHLLHPAFLARDQQVPAAAARASERLS